MCSKLQTAFRVPAAGRCGCGCGQVIGVLNLFCTDRATISDTDVALDQALCDIATVALLQERTLR